MGKAWKGACMYRSGPFKKSTESIWQFNLSHQQSDPTDRYHFEWASGMRFADRAWLKMRDHVYMICIVTWNVAPVSSYCR